MRKFITTALAALTFGGAVAATGQADARPYYRGGGYYRHHDGGGDKAAVAAVAGIAGLAIGAALSSKGNGGGYGRGYSRSSSYYSGYSYDPRYDSYSGGYDRGYDDRGYYDRPERICISRERVWDPYIGRNVSIERRYPC